MKYIIIIIIIIIISTTTTTTIRFTTLLETALLADIHLCSTLDHCPCR